MERDFVGYGSRPPRVRWHADARVAINFVINYEEGAERNILDGDSEAESFLVDIPCIKIIPWSRHLSSESMFEYGSRCGIWRLLNLFDQYQLPVTLFATGLALQRNLALCNYLKTAPHEVAGHGYRWIDYRAFSRVDEKRHMIQTLDIIQTLTHQSVQGWYTGRSSDYTRELVAETNLLYDSQSYADDLPYWANVNPRSLLIIPYSLDTNDIRYCSSPGWSSAEDAFLYLKYAFDCLYREGEQSPKLLTIGLHPRLSGRPARAQALYRFIDYIQNKAVWCCTRREIADIWIQQFPMV